MNFDDVLMSWLCRCPLSCCSLPCGYLAHRSVISEALRDWSLQPKRFRKLHQFYSDQNRRLQQVGSACVFPQIAFQFALQITGLPLRSIVFGWATTQTAMMQSRQILPTMSEESLSFKERCYQIYQSPGV